MHSYTFQIKKQIKKRKPLIIYEDKISTIKYDAKSQNVTFVEDGLARKELLLAQLKAVLVFSETHPVLSTIFDFRKLFGSFKNTFDFLNTEYFPTLKSQGLKCKVFVISDDIINTYLSNELVINIRKQHDIPAKIFANTEDAEEWISIYTKPVVS